MDSDDELFFHLMMEEEADAAANKEDQLRMLTYLKALQVELKGMENEADNANDMVEEEKSTGSAPGQMSSCRNPKRLRSKVWDDFTPIYIDGKVARAECMHCYQVFNNNGTSKLLKHQAKCSPSAEKRPVQQELPFLLTNQNKSSDTTDVLPQKKARVLPSILTDMNMESQKIDQNVVNGYKVRSGKNPAPNVVLVPPSDLHQHLGGLLLTGKGADVMFEAGGEKFAAHRCVLAARSPVFSAELFGSMKEGSTDDLVHIDGIEAQVFRALLCFVYTDSLPEMNKEEEDTMCQHLLVTADTYNMERLKLICEDKLCKCIDVGTVANILALAEAHHCHVLKSVCFCFLGRKENLMAFMASDGFKHLNASCPPVVKEL